MPWAKPTIRNSTELATECSKPRKAKMKTDMIMTRLLVRSSLMKPL